MATAILRPIKTEADYDAALKDIERHFENEPEPGTPESDRFDMLALLIDDYERKHWAIDAPDPVAAIRSHMENAGFRQSQFATLIGSRSRASEILNRRRHLTVEAIWKLNQKWGIPAECLIKPYRLKSGTGTKNARRRRAHPTSSTR